MLQVLSLATGAVQLCRCAGARAGGSAYTPTSSAGQLSLRPSLKPQSRSSSTTSVHAPTLGTGPAGNNGPGRVGINNDAGGPHAGGSAGEQPPTPTAAPGQLRSGGLLVQEGQVAAGQMRWRRPVGDATPFELHGQAASLSPASQPPPSHSSSRGSSRGSSARSWQEGDRVGSGATPVQGVGAVPGHAPGVRPGSSVRRPMGGLALGLPDAWSVAVQQSLLGQEPALPLSARTTGDRGAGSALLTPRPLTVLPAADRGGKGSRAPARRRWLEQHKQLDSLAGASAAPQVPQPQPVQPAQQGEEQVLSQQVPAQLQAQHQGASPDAEHTTSPQTATVRADLARSDSAWLQLQRQGQLPPQLGLHDPPVQAAPAAAAAGGPQQPHQQDLPHQVPQLPAQGGQSPVVSPPETASPVDAAAAASHVGVGTASAAAAAAAAAAAVPAGPDSAAQGSTGGRPFVPSLNLQPVSACCAASACLAAPVAALPHPSLLAASCAALVMEDMCLAPPPLA